MQCPQVTLDTTLAELYNPDGPANNDRQLALLLGVPNSEVAPNSKLARNTKYLYQDSRFSNTPETIAPKEREETEQSVAAKYLSLIPQRDAFTAGNMPVIIFEPDRSEKAFGHSKKETERTISSLTAAQRPKLLFFSDHTQIFMDNGISRLATKMAFDEVEGLPLALDLDTHYFLNSKAALCTSGLPRYVAFERNAYFELQSIDRRWELSLLTRIACQSQGHATRIRRSQRRARKVLQRLQV